MAVSSEGEVGGVIPYLAQHIPRLSTSVRNGGCERILGKRDLYLMY